MLILAQIKQRGGEPALSAAEGTPKDPQPTCREGWWLGVSEGGGIPLPFRPVVGGSFAVLRRALRATRLGRAQDDSEVVLSTSCSTPDSNADRCLVLLKGTQISTVRGSCGAQSHPPVTTVVSSIASRTHLGAVPQPDVVLIHPPSVFDFRERTIFYGPISDVIPSSPVFEMYPVGFLTLAAYLRRHGYRVRIINLALLMMRTRCGGYVDSRRPVRVPGWGSFDRPPPLRASRYAAPAAQDDRGVIVTPTAPRSVRAKPCGAEGVGCPVTTSTSRLRVFA